MLLISTDVEANGPFPGVDTGYSMYELGAVVVEPGLTRTFFGQLRPISPNFDREALHAVGRTHAQTLEYPSPIITMRNFDRWLCEVAQGQEIRFVSDNNGYDWQFVNYYSWYFLKHNRFGHTSWNMGNLARGAARDLRFDWKQLRRTPHTHHPVDDARGNAEALLAIGERYGLNLDF